MKPIFHFFQIVVSLNDHREARPRAFVAKSHGGALSQALRKLRTRREELNLSQADVADALGVNASYIGLLERGERSPSVEVLLKLAEAVQVSPADLFSPAKASPVNDAAELQQLRVLMKRWAPGKRRALVAIAKTIGSLDG